MHGIAFSHGAVQDVLAEIEAASFGKTWCAQPVERPIFITSLPRAGTTFLLRVLHRVENVATFTYRDMPFVRAPILWRRLSRHFQVDKAAIERAHRDGILINPDSPEALEEPLWLSRFPRHYQDDGIALWRQADAKFALELADMMRRVVVLRKCRVRPDARYLSKNNANIARIPLLRAAFPEARILVPLREPLAQATSMHRQHTSFLSRHREERFSRRYMRDTGHFEFGDLHRPILFDGVAELRSQTEPSRLEYWIGYWVAAYRHLSKQHGVEFLDVAEFCQDGRNNFQRLCRKLELPVDPQAVDEAATEVKPLRQVPEPDVKPKGLGEARRLFEELQTRRSLA